MILSAISKDDWDRWNDDRDGDLQRSQSYRYVGRDVAGADDLDQHGRWVYDSPYGWVWVPNVTSTWAPYRVGRWSYVNYYGWTWLSGDPWGWAPYHYGRWYSSPYGWAWYPGQVGYRSYWRPALVGFFGWGNSSVSFGVGFGFGNVGWVPLAPYEVYRPWYGPRYRNGINVTNITVVNNTNIVNVYRNARQFNGRNAVTSVPAGNFGRGRVNNDNFVRATNTDLARAGHVQGAVPFDTNRDSRRYSDRTPTPDIAARASNNRDRQFATVQGPRNGVASNVGVERGQGNRPAVDRTGVNRSPAPTQPGGRRFDPSGNSGNTGTADRSGNTRSPDVRSIDNSRGTFSNAPNAGVNDNRSRRQSSDVGPQPQQRNQVPSSQPVQINPPIVRDRGYGGAPASNQRSATPNFPSAPRGDGGGRSSTPSAPPAGGGTIRSGGGGGGGQRGDSAPARNSGGSKSGSGDRGGGKGDGDSRRR